jgi:hypothetical protein
MLAILYLFYFSPTGFGWVFVVFSIMMLPLWGFV